MQVKSGQFISQLCKIKWKATEQQNRDDKHSGGLPERQMRLFR